MTEDLAPGPGGAGAAETAQPDAAVAVAVAAPAPAPAPAVTAGAVTVRIGVAGAAQMRLLGSRLAGLLRSGDLVVLTGPLGAGKTTMVQGIGAGLVVRGPVTSPTFVIARVHPSLRDGPALVHADAYRLGSRVEVDDLDLDADLDRSVTVVEWGEGLVENLAPGYLQITIGWAGPSTSDEPGDEPRLVSMTGHGDRWQAAAESLRGAAAEPLRSAPEPAAHRVADDQRCVTADTGQPSLF